MTGDMHAEAPESAVAWVVHCPVRIGRVFDDHGAVWPPEFRHIAGTGSRCTRALVVALPDRPRTVAVRDLDGVLVFDERRTRDCRHR